MTNAEQIRAAKIGYWLCLVLLFPNSRIFYIKSSKGTEKG